MDEHQTPSPSAVNSRKRLIPMLALVALAAASLAGYALTRGDHSPDGPQPVSLQDLAGGELAAQDRAPDFTVPTLGGGRFSLSAHQADPATPVLLNLWASWCLPCREEMPALEAASARYPNVEIVGVAVQDDLVAAEAFATEIGVTYTIGFDERDEVNALYQSFGLPVSFVIGADGTILQAVYGELDVAKIDALFATWFGG